MDLFILYIGILVCLVGISLIAHKLVRFIFICILIGLLGMVRYTIAFPQINIEDGKQDIVGHIATEPDIRQDGIRYIVEQADGQRMYFKTGLYPRYAYGDVLSVSCIVQIPEPIEDFRYDMYLARFGVFRVCSHPTITQLDSRQGSTILSGIFSVKDWVAGIVNQRWHEPYAGFMAGLLYGYRGGLGSLNDLFAITGVTHIIAISGYNITIISTILIGLCIHIYIPRKKAFWLVCLGIIIFVIFAGASASVVRAGIMGVIVLVARQVGRQSAIFNVMILTAVIMTIHNPFILVWDAGFQLSFLSTLGLIYLSPLLEPYGKWLPSALEIRESFLATISATVMTLPLILFQFGRLSIVAVIVNVLILWIIPYIMMLGFASVVTWWIVPLSILIAWIAWLGMRYIVLIVEFFAALPFASVDMHISFVWMVVLYMLLYMFMRRRVRSSS